MSNTTKRIIAGIFMAAIAAVAALMQYFGIPAVKYLVIAVAILMMIEYLLCLRKTPLETLRNNWKSLILLAALLALVIVSTFTVGNRPWLILLLLMIICSADIGAWFFGKLIGGDKMWEKLSANKTWAGQIAGIICGTCAGVLYGLLGADTFMPQLMWIGISVSLLSQYGDLTASWIKRKLGIKDFANTIPGHGGLLDRFDGWIYALPILWFVLV
jgi:phosphatidate cytidylyltransferase